MKPAERDGLRPLARRDGEPVFDEPWQAQTLAIAAALVDSDAISAARWSQTLGAALRKAEAEGAEDSPQTYYRSALVALETSLVDAGYLCAGDLEARVAAWRRAYLNTPHGAPVELAAGLGNRR